MTLQGRNGEDMDITEEIPCDGGALVVRRMPYSIPRNLAGLRVCYRMAASAHYPKRRGKLVHFNAGHRCASREETNPLPYGCTFALLTLPIGTYAWGKSAPTVVDVLLPEGAADHVPDDIPIEQELLWEPTSSVGGFPVLPRTNVVRKS